jgi:hypothetical protein
MLCKKCLENREQGGNYSFHYGTEDVVESWKEPYGSGYKIHTRKKYDVLGQEDIWICDGCLQKGRNSLTRNLVIAGVILILFGAINLIAESFWRFVGDGIYFGLLTIGPICLSALLLAIGIHTKYFESKASVGERAAIELRGKELQTLHGRNLIFYDSSKYSDLRKMLNGAT